MRLVNLFIALFLFTVSCKKTENTNVKIKSPFTIKYEFITSVPTVRNTNAIVRYTNSAQGITGVAINEAPWSTSVTMTAESRPISLSFKGSSIELSAPGAITGNIYINGIKKATLTEASRKGGAGPFFNDFALFDMNFIVE
jgi:hypothetical protein